VRTDRKPTVPHRRRRWPDDGSPLIREAEVGSDAAIRSSFARHECHAVETAGRYKLRGVGLPVYAPISRRPGFALALRWQGLRLLASNAMRQGPSGVGVPCDLITGGVVV
jgi:hypothetical protein